MPPYTNPKADELTTTWFKNPTDEFAMPPYQGPTELVFQLPCGCPIQIILKPATCFTQEDINNPEFHQHIANQMAKYGHHPTRCENDLDDPDTKRQLIEKIADYDTHHQTRQFENLKQRHTTTHK